jgi:hypothetical protein
LSSKADLSSIFDLSLGSPTPGGDDGLAPLIKTSDVRLSGHMYTRFGVFIRALHIEDRGQIRRDPFGWGTKHRNSTLGNYLPAFLLQGNDLTEELLLALRQRRNRCLLFDVLNRYLANVGLV